MIHKLGEKNPVCQKALVRSTLVVRGGGVL